MVATHELPGIDGPETFLPKGFLAHTVPELLDYRLPDTPEASVAMFPKVPNAQNYFHSLGYSESAVQVYPTDSPCTMNYPRPAPDSLFGKPPIDKLLRLGAFMPEARLDDSFSSMLAQISFGDVVVRMRKSKPVVDQENFRFVPVLRMETSLALTILQYQVIIPAGIRKTYKEIGGNPFLDTPHAIGLVYRDWLVAVGGAQVKEGNKLLVKQLQDVTNVRRRYDPEKFAQTGLRNGFWWADTLVKAWEEIAKKLIISEVGIQSNANSSYHTVRNAGDRGYDDVAKRMHYDPDETTGNWVRKINY